MKAKISARVTRYESGESSPPPRMDIRKKRRKNLNNRFKISIDRKTRLC